MIPALIMFLCITIPPAAALAMVLLFTLAPEAPEWMDDD